MREFKLSKTTFSLQEMWCSWTLLNMGINALIHNDCNSISNSSIHSCQVRLLERYDICVVDHCWQYTRTCIVCHPMKNWGYQWSYEVDILGTGMMYVLVSCCISNLYLTSMFHIAQLRIMVQGCIWYSCQGVNCRCLVLLLAQIWMFGTCISYHLVEMILLPAFAVAVTIAANVSGCMAVNLNLWCSRNSIPCCQSFCSFISTA